MKAVLFTPVFSSLPDIIQTCLSGLLPHRAQLSIWRELRNWFREVFVERVATLLLYFPRFRRIFITVTAV